MSIISESKGSNMKVVELRDGKLDSFMPYEVAVHKLLEGGGSVLESVSLFPVLDKATDKYNNLVVSLLDSPIKYR